MPDDRAIFGHGEGPSHWKDVVPPVLMALGAFTLLKTSRLLSLAVLGAWLYDTACEHDRGRTRNPAGAAEREPPKTAPTNRSRLVDVESEDSFPASDPPSYSGSTAGAP